MSAVAEEINDSELEEDTQKDKFLTFEIEKEIYGIEINLVTEIIGIQPITEVPEVPNYVKGIINLRGKIIPVMDVRLRFKKEFREYNDRTCVVVIESGNVVLGLIVDSVAEVLVIPEENIVPPPEIKSSKNKYIKGIGKVGETVKLLIDCDKIFNEQAEGIQ
ncbi:MAG: chemotaxis protein CheW [Massilibacillus sp.]|jgi:purine-binding chemotaxis protein CheW|nr:chemotaxis protein CheW [Massilibacillus sp.]